MDYNALVRQLYGEDISTEKLILPRIRENKKLTNSTVNVQNKAFGSSIAENPYRPAVPNEYAGKDFGVDTWTIEKNLDVIESPSVKLARLKLKRNKIISEKGKVEKKLLSIEEQRKSVMDSFKQTRMHKSSSSTH